MYTLFHFNNHYELSQLPKMWSKSVMFLRLLRLYLYFIHREKKKFIRKD